MRIISSNNNSQFTVIRGALGTRKENHDAGSLIRKINPIAVEFRRPSTLRASGHTFEYLGYGPGNYSTGLPQVQVKSLSEREDFLVQSQERAGGIVVYTGMNNSGDFFSGNTKTSSSSGEVISYDIPSPTVTGEDPSKSSVVYDEVTVKERLLVEGGDSGTVLSQFDGPVTFNKQIRSKDSSTFSGQVRVTNTTSSDSTGKGALTVKGGVGVGENLNVGGETTLLSTTDSTSSTTGALIVSGGVGIAKNLNVGGTVLVTGISTFSSLLDANAGATIDNVRIGVANDNTIDTSSGNLNLSASAGSLVNILTDTSITGTLSVTGNTTLGTENTDVTTVNGELRVTQDIIAFYTPSDKNWKDNITPINDSLAKVLSISGNTFDWNEKSNQSGKDIGVVAQEVLEVLPEAVVEREDGHLSVAYHKIVPLLVEAIKELSHKVEVLEQKLQDK
jgi:hypothetical protein